MKRVQRRTLITLCLTAILALGLMWFCGKCAMNGRGWVNYFAGTSLYQSGSIYDRNGTVLYDGNTGSYAEDESTRVSTLHLIGDGNTSTSVRRTLSSRLAGYNPITGTTLGRHDLTLTVDADLNRVAYQALKGKKGTVGVYNYKTGEVLCMVSAPSYDPTNPPTDIEGNSAYEGVYLNRFISSTFPPGSIFKLVTTAAAIDTLSGLWDMRFDCTGSTVIQGETFTCPYAHGSNMDVGAALAKSCNGAYAQIALELGGQTLLRYTEEGGLLDRLDVNGLTTAAGSFTAEAGGSASLGWSGVGQDKNMVNPCAFMTLMGGVANNGTAVLPRLVESETLSGSKIPAALGAGSDTKKIWSPATCSALKEMMRNNVTSSYSDLDFGGLPVCAKSGTAEVGGGAAPHAWFTGFVDDNQHPWAFIVLVENGGSGASTAGSVAAKVLRSALEG